MEHLSKKTMSNKSSIDWLVKQYSKYCDDSQVPFEVFEKAKAMHKEEIINSFGVGCHLESKRLVGYHDIAEQYYKETFGGNNDN
jgi:hypothetical protein